MKRLIAAVCVAAVAGGCTDTPEEEGRAPSAEVTASVAAEWVERAGWCDDLAAQPLRELEAAYGFIVESGDDAGPHCHASLDFVDGGEPVSGANGMSFGVGAQRFESRADAAAAFAAQADPGHPDFLLELSASRPVPPGEVDLPWWDGARIAASAPDEPIQELRGLLHRDRIILFVELEVDPTRFDAEPCSPVERGEPCAMTLSLARAWVEADFAAAAASVVAGLDE